jgi:HSP20 family protein
MNVMKREQRTTWPLEMVWNQDLVDSAFRDMLHNFFGGSGVFDRLVEGATHLVRVEEFVDGEECVMRAELPGIDPRKDVELTVVDGVLHLSAKREERSEEERSDGYRSEFRYGQLTRDFRLPEGATDADVRATYKDGILEVRVPAPKPFEPETAKKIPVTPI